MSGENRKKGAVEGKVCIVTGGGGGIGKAICERLASEGGKVVIAERNEETGKSVERELRERGQEAIFISTDVSQESSIESCVKQTVEKYGAIHILVNNAASFEFGHLGEPGTGSGKGTDKEISESAWNSVFQVNVRGPATFIKCVVPHMKRNDPYGETYSNVQPLGKSEIKAQSRGCIVNVNSVSGFIAQPEFVPYNCSKGAALQLTRCCAMDLAPWKIRVNAVCPGTVETPASHAHMQLLGLSLEQGRLEFGRSCLLQRQASPEEIAGPVLFLVSDDSSFITGTTLTVDGGATI